MKSRSTLEGKDLTLAMIGCGAMGSSILSGILDSSAKEAKSGESDALISRFIACVHTKPSAERLESRFSTYSDRLTILYHDNLQAFRSADVVMLACKPNMAEAVLGEDGVREALGGKLLISVLAGTTTAQMKNYISLPSAPANSEMCTIVKAMPNMAAQLGESITIISTSSPTPPQAFADVTEWIFNQIGRVSYMPDNLFQAGGVLGGATPAFLSVAFDGILDGAVSEGIKRDDAKDILAQSLLGLAKLMQNGEHPAILREKISSPKGTTIQGLNSLAKLGIRSAFSQAYIASVEHGKSMG